MLGQQLNCCPNIEAPGEYTEGFYLVALNAHWAWVAEPSDASYTVNLLKF